jgi:hypothetical protein
MLYHLNVMYEYTHTQCTALHGLHLCKFYDAIKKLIHKLIIVCSTLSAIFSLSTTCSAKKARPAAGQEVLAGQTG